MHAPNESVDPDEIANMALAEALFLQRYAGARVAECRSPERPVRRHGRAGAAGPAAVPALPGQRAHRRGRGGQPDRGAPAPGRRRVRGAAARVSVLPTYLVVALEPGRPATLEPTRQLRGTLRLDQTAALFDILKAAERGELTPRRRQRADPRRSST